MYTDNLFNTNGVNKKKLRKAIYIYIAIMLVIIFSSRTIYNFTIPRVNVAMPQRGRLIMELQARGVISFSESFGIYATSSGQINEILIKRGDLIDEDTVIATLREGVGAGAPAVNMDFTIERINNQLSGLALNRAAIQDRLRRLNADEAEEPHSLKWAAMDAGETLERRKNDLLDAQRFVEIPFNDFHPVQALTASEREWNKLVAELRDAQADLLIEEASGGNVFDDFIYLRNINEAATALERRQSDLQEAEDALSGARGGGASSFDNHIYQTAINTARTAVSRSQEDYNNALRQLDNAIHHYNITIASGVSVETIAAARRGVDDAQSLVISTRRALDDATAALNRSMENMRRAEKAFNENRTETRHQSISEAEARVTQATFALEDARQAYENAVAELNRARTSFNTNMEESRERAVSDAKRRVEAALSAINDMIWIAGENLSEAEKNLEGAQAALERAEINLDIAQRASVSQAAEARASLGLDLQRADLDIASANIDLREAAASMRSEDTGGIRADYQGVVVSVEKNRGQFVSQGEKIATVGVDNNIFITEITVSQSDGRFIEIGDTAGIHKSGGGSSIQAVVYDIELMGDTLKISLICETDEFSGGEFITVRFRKQTEIFNTLVPSEAIFREGTNNFVWVIHSRQGVLGTEYITVRHRVIIADSDDFHTAIARGLEFIAPVVINHDRDLIINGRVSRME